MSEFIDYIESEWTDRRAPITGKMMTTANIDAEVDCRAHPFTVKNEYKFKVKYEVRIKAEDVDLQAASKNAADQLRHAVYGSMYNRLIHLERAVLEQNKSAAMSEIRDMRIEMWML